MTISETKQWITKPSSQTEAPVSTNPSDEESNQFALDSAITPAARFEIQRFGYQEAKFLRQSYLTQKLQDSAPSPLKEFQGQGNATSSGFGIPLQKSSAAFASDFLAMGQSQDSSDCNTKSNGIATP